MAHDDPSTPAGTRDVADRHRFDVDRLATWMRATVGRLDGPLTVRQFKGGQSNPTFWLTDGRARWVLRKKPPGQLLPSAHQVEREHRVLEALADTDVPVPAVHGLCTDAEVIGTPFYLMDVVEGRIFWNVQLPGLEPAERSAIYEELGRVLAAVHQVDIDAVGLGDFGRRGGYLARQLKRWTGQYRASETQAVPPMDALIAWLEANLPPSDETTLVHGDYRLDNMVFHPREPRCLAVLDWELSTLGHPLSDLAYTSMLYDIQMPRVGGLLGVDFAETGIPDEATFVSRYRALTGRSEIPDWPAFKAFSLFRLAAIAQGVYKRGLEGNASSDQTAMYGAAVGHLAGVACALVGIDPRAAQR